MTGSTGVLSVLLLVFSGVSLTRRMQRMYLQAWRLAPVRASAPRSTPLLGLVTLVVEISLLSLVRTVLRGLPFDGAGPCCSACRGTSCSGPRSRGCCSTAGSAGGGCSGRRADGGLPPALYGVATTVYMPRLIATYSVQYGLFGVTLALVGWLLSVSMIVVTATVVAAELDRADDSWARRLRSLLGSDPVTDAPRLPPQG